MRQTILLRFVYLILTVIFLFTASFLPGCNSSPGEYRSTTVKSQFCYYSLEYPSQYKKDGPHTETEYDIPFTIVYFYAPVAYDQLLVPAGDSGLKTVNAEYIPAGITIDVFPPSDNPNISQNASEYIDELLKDMAKWSHFELYERSSVVISGVEGELVRYVVDLFLPVQESDKPKLEYNWLVYFDYNGYIWNIKAWSKLGEANEQVNEYFEHLIETFKILD